MGTNLLKSVLHNIGVVVVSAGFALLGVGLDELLGLQRFRSDGAMIAGALLVLAGFLVRVWATYDFYEREMAVISLEPQHALITTGPYRYSRNPLYLGGNVFAFLGMSLLAGSPGAVLLTVVNVVFLDRWMIPREERQLAQQFGDAWTAYRARVRRWI